MRFHVENALYCPIIYRNHNFHDLALRFLASPTGVADQPLGEFSLRAIYQNIGEQIQFW